ncbi:cytoskeleton protein RodZ [Xenorhabdus sp. Reich]|uniref:Cytoskeleton protein RodZ n=1 Tax=Xenorhabdus littoralis TaxID=2582835 RepID=A0ABU4SMK8_9GAMM|nr:cytoskeleton protein RodZ [Xenorhabdus sp. Reich]MDX7999814.1 cytoskeleton protein RodZ [Xenorhabdus sp. Reich]
MKTETYPEEANLTAGQILRQAREKLELSQQIVADRLCLKLSTVRDIEEDNVPSNIAPTFFRGYIRAYAKLVQVPESVILSTLDEQMPAKMIKTSPMQSFSAGKKRKKRDGWLMKLTWVVIIMLLGMTGLWWWQNYKAQQTELSSMAEQSSARIAQTHGDENDVGNSAAAADKVSPKGNQSVVVSQEQAKQGESTGADSNAPVTSNAPVSTTQPKTVPLPANQSTANTVAENTASAINTGTTNSVSANAGSNPVVSPSSSDVDSINTVSNNELLMNFSGKCWLLIKDAKGKILFSGMKNKGDSLKLSGVLPYSLNIGAPARVNVQFQGKPVDLSTFIKKGVSAKLTLK